MIVKCVIVFSSLVDFFDLPSSSYFDSLLLSDPAMSFTLTSIHLPLFEVNEALAVLLDYAIPSRLEIPCSTLQTVACSD